MDRFLYYKKGDIVFLAGSPSDCAYIVEYGRLEVVEWSGGPRRVLETLTANDIFGEMGLIDGQSRSATVVALDDCKLRAFDREAFDALCNANPKALLPILKVLTSRLRETSKLLKEEYRVPGSVRRKVLNIERTKSPKRNWRLPDYKIANLKKIATRYPTTPPPSKKTYVFSSATAKTSKP